MRARLIEIIEVRVGNVRRHFTTTGESIGLVEDAGADGEEPASGADGMREHDDAMAEVPRRSAASIARRTHEDAALEKWKRSRAAPPLAEWTAPPFDPCGPRIEMGAPRTEPEADE